MNIETWPIEKLIPYERNARKIPQAAVDKIAASLKEYGWRQPIVVAPDGVIVVGHGRRLGALQLGLTEAPVHVAHGLTAAQIKAYRLMDNRSNRESRWDMDLLSVEFKDLAAIKFDVSLTGFSRVEIPRVLAPQQSEASAPQLGADLEHRIVVDCTSEEHQAELLAMLEGQGLKCRALMS